MYSKFAKIRTPIFRNTRKFQINLGHIWDWIQRNGRRILIHVTVITYVLSTQKKRLIETFLYAHKTCLCRKKLIQILGGGGIHVDVYLPISLKTNNSK